MNKLKEMTDFIREKEKKMEAENEAITIIQLKTITC